MAGKTNMVKGQIKEAAGVSTGNKKLRAAGKTDQAIGKVKPVSMKAVGKSKQSVQKPAIKGQKALNKTR